MSGGLQAQGLARGIQAGHARIREQNQDFRRGEFLRAINVEVENLSDFESTFIADFRRERAAKDSALDFQWFTPGRRKVADSMIKRYGFRSLRMPTVTREIPKAAPGTCGFLKREAGQRNILCGQPASTKLQSGLELCAECDQARKENLERVRQLKMRNMR